MDKVIMNQIPRRKIMIAVKGAGDLASGIALRLWRGGFPVILSELPQPLCIRRTVAFSEAVRNGYAQVEDTRATRIEEPEEASSLWENGVIPVIVDPAAEKLLRLRPDVLIDARLIKSYREDTAITDAPLVIGLGPGFCAGKNVHCVIETMRGHSLGRVIWEGEAEPNTGIPGTIRGEGIKRVVKAPCAGIFQPCVEIGDSVEEGAVIARVDEISISARLSGIVRGIIQPGIPVEQGLKIMDIDPRGDPAHCWTVSDKASAIGGGVLEAILSRF